MNSYLGELRTQWRPLTSVIVGLSSGLVMSSYVIGIMGPYLVTEFGWAKEDMALVGILALGAVLLLPLIGRMTDVFGVRKTAMIGVIASPVSYFILSRIDSFAAYAIMFALQASILATTTPPVYCRIVVQYFKRARGLALGIAAAGPAMAVAVGGPLLNNFVDDYGWRAGYIAMAIYTAISGILAMVLLPPERRDGQAKAAKPKRAKEDYRMIFRSSAFWILFAGILLCNLPQSIMMSQLSLILAENGASGKSASIMISSYAVGMIVGRLVSGVALDRFPAPLVATIGLALSGIGLLIIASGLDARPVVFFAVLTFGLSLGAESDVIAYLVVRNFGVKIYSSVHSILATSTALAAVLGSVMLSITLRYFVFYAPFLGVTGALAVLGSLLFLFLPRNPQMEDEPAGSTDHAERGDTAPVEGKVAAA
ncbi:Sugar phosphate permease [Novosphingobium sp. CF614]|uniref:MFS transporter n=1 Tax=Novosphingobium sp. CF614 TaxID=1884364 RepID=UPI0008E4F91C|nr:MFS transporter [Novosphingobium sp. CF614]SFF77319.1 Sugar phosphate permease [Novosphingobium sp. CF614]